MPIVQGILTNADASLARNARVIVQLWGVESPIEGFIGGTDIVGDAVTFSDATTAQWSVSLFANSTITPSGTVYKLTEFPWQGDPKESFILVPAGGGPYNLLDVLVNPPASLPSPMRSFCMLQAGIRTNVIVSQINAQLVRPGNSNAQGIPMTHAGSIIGIAVAVDGAAARTAGTLTVKVFKSGSQLGTLSTTIDATHTQTNVASQTAGVDSFAIGDVLDVRYSTTSDYAPVSNADLEAWLMVAHS